MALLQPTPLSYDVFSHSLPMPVDASRDDVSSNEAGTICAPHHTLASFLDQRAGGRGWSLAWRSRLPPSASLDVESKPEVELEVELEPELEPGLDGGRWRQSSKPFGASADAAHRLRRTHSVHVATADDVERIRYDMNDFVRSTVWANHDRLQTRPSVLERGRGAQGVFVRRASRGEDQDELLPPWLALTAGEHLHVHADGSSHMILSLADAITAIERGWAESETAPTEDSRAAVPLGYVAVHAPRNAAELAEWKQLALASVRYCSYPWGGLEIRRPEQL